MRHKADKTTAEVGWKALLLAVLNGRIMRRCRMERRDTSKVVVKGENVAKSDTTKVAGGA